jgi:DNA-binding MarR family transcriptional regulator
MDAVLLGMRTIRSEMRGKRPEDVSVPQFRVLTFLRRREGASLSDVAEHVGLTLPSMSKAVDGLVKRGLVARETSSYDRRRVTLALTADGKEALQAATQATRARIAEMLDTLSPEEQATVVEAMQILRPLFASYRRCPK